MADEPVFPPTPRPPALPPVLPLPEPESQTPAVAVPSFQRFHMGIAPSVLFCSALLSGGGLYALALHRNRSLETFKSTLLNVDHSLALIESRPFFSPDTLERTQSLHENARVAGYLWNVPLNALEAEQTVESHLQAALSELSQADERISRAPHPISVQDLEQPTRLPAVLKDMSLLVERHAWPQFETGISSLLTHENGKYSEDIAEFLRALAVGNPATREAAYHHALLATAALKVPQDRFFALWYDQGLILKNPPYGSLEYEGRPRPEVRPGKAIASFAKAIDAVSALSTREQCRRFLLAYEDLVDLCVRQRQDHFAAELLEYHAKKAALGTSEAGLVVELCRAMTWEKRALIIATDMFHETASHLKQSESGALLPGDPTVLRDLQGELDTAETKRTEHLRTALALARECGLEQVYSIRESDHLNGTMASRPIIWGQRSALNAVPWPDIPTPPRSQRPGIEISLSPQGVLRMRDNISEVLFGNEIATAKGGALGTVLYFLSAAGLETYVQGGPGWTNFKGNAISAASALAQFAVLDVGFSMVLTSLGAGRTVAVLAPFLSAAFMSGLSLSTRRILRDRGYAPALLACARDGLTGVAFSLGMRTGHAAFGAFAAKALSSKVAQSAVASFTGLVVGQCTHGGAHALLQGLENHLNPREA